MRRNDVEAPSQGCLCNAIEIGLCNDALSICITAIELSLEKPNPFIPKAQQVLQEMYDLYGFIDQTGYEAMPEEFYKAWLQSFNDQKGKQPILMIKP
jgi:hypothetical protein